MSVRPPPAAPTLLLALALVVALAAPAAVAPAAVAPTAPDPPQDRHLGPASEPTPDGARGDDGPRPDQAGTDRAPPGNATGSAAAEVRRLHLVTGQTVAVSERGGERSFEVLSGGPVDVVTAGDRTYLLPEGFDPATYDRSLFSLEALLAAQADGGGLPVLLETDAPAATIEGPGLDDVRRLRSAGVVAAELDPAAVEPGAGTGVAGMVEDGLVRGVSLDRSVEPPATAPGSTARSLARPGNLTGAGVTVAVLDTGVDATHPALADRVVDQVDFVEGDADGSVANDAVDGAGAGEVAPDANGHGTHVAGVVAGSGDAEGDHAGVAPGADLLDVRVMDDRGGGRTSAIVAGIEYAVERDVDVILLSVGSSVDGGEAIAASVEWATERGVVVVAAAGNDGVPRAIGAAGRPARAITVGATDGEGAVAGYSSRGPTLDGRLKPDLVAPGRGIVGPLSSNADRAAIGDAPGYTRMSGTSAATPLVAGAAALLLEAEPGLTAREVEARLGSAARPVGGGDAFAQGSGAIDVEGALHPDVVVSDPAVDFGLLDSAATVNRTLAVTNHDDRRHDLTFDLRVRNVDLGVDAPEAASLDRTRLSLAPGERANLTLSVDGDVASGAHAGEVRYSVAGEPRSVAFGFVRGGTVTVEKRSLSPGGRVDGEPLWVHNEEGTHDELLQFEDGTASFVAGGGTYYLWSWGTDEPTGTQVYLSERRVFDRPTRLVLDEGETVPVGVDAGAIESRYGPLTNRSVTVSTSTGYGDELTKLSVTKQDAPSRAVRASADPGLSIATSYLLTTRPRGSAPLDVADVFQLAHGVDGVAGPSVVRPEPDRLATAEQRLHRSTVDETYRVSDRVRIDGVWNRIERRWYGVGDRRTQRVHRFPAAATYHRTFRGGGWVAHRVARGESAASEESRTSAAVLSHPMHALVETVRFEDGNATVAGAPFADGAGTRFEPAGDHRLAVSVDGDVVHDEPIRRGSASVEGVPVEAGQRLDVRLAGNRSGGRLSTRTLTEVTVPRYVPAGANPTTRANRPPLVTNVSVLGADDANAAGPGEVTAVFEVDVVGPAVSPTVWYSAGDPEAPPWEGGSGWERADVERRDDRLLGTFEVEASAGTVSLAAALGDIRGHRTRTMTVDAFHVGEAPNTSSSVLSGRLLAANGSGAANDTVVVDAVEGGPTRYVPTDEAGRFSVELPRGRSYDLTYVRGEPWVVSEPTGGHLPAWLPLSRVHLDDDLDLGTRSLPAPRTVRVAVTDERGEPVDGATVRVRTRGGNRSATETLATGPDGLARRFGGEGTGIDLAGAVEVTVDPAETDLYPAQVHRRNLTAADPGVVNVTVRTAPPEAVPRAFGTFEPGAAVFLDATQSRAPAGVAAYRWDLDGDGRADRVTEDSIIRYVPAEGTLGPTLTVVDRAGKTDSATLSVRLHENETEPR